jgi:GxxExxY protein
VAEGSGGGLEFEALTERIIGAAIKVQRALGSGLLESAYEACLAYELQQQGIPSEAQVPLEIRYGALVIPNAYRMDMVVAEAVVLELKTVEKLVPAHEAQLMTYLRFGGKRLGLLLNFWAWPLKEGGIKRVLNPDPPPLPSGFSPLPSA